HPGLEQMALGWDGPAQDYWVEVAHDAAYKDVLLKGLVHQPSVNVPVPARGRLYWRAFTPDGKKQIAHGSAQFAPERKTGELAGLRNEVPEGSEKTTIYYQDKPPAVT